MQEFIIDRLNEFCRLEKFQVAYYEAQLSTATSQYYRKAFTQLAKIESNHVKFFEDQLIQLTGQVPNISGSLYELAGTILGESAEFSGSANTCKLGMLLESRAIKFYKNFILEAKDYPTLRDTLMEYLLEEEFHALWLDNYAKQHS